MVMSKAREVVEIEVHDHIKLSAQPWRDGVGKHAQRRRYNVRALFLLANVQ
jgi:hypothetical protein